MYFSRDFSPLAFVLGMHPSVLGTLCCVFHSRHTTAVDLQSLFVHPQCLSVIDFFKTAFFPILEARPPEDTRTTGIRGALTLKTRHRLQRFQQTSFLTEIVVPNASTDRSTGSRSTGDFPIPIRHFLEHCLRLYIRMRVDGIPGNKSVVHEDLQYSFNIQGVSLE